MALGHDGKTIASGYGGGVVLRDENAVCKRLADAPLDVKVYTVRSVAFSPDGKTVADGDDQFGERVLQRVDGVVQWDVAGRNRRLMPRSR